MSRMTEAMDAYFEKLAEVWQEDGTGPMVPWDKEYDQTLFVSGPNEDGDAEWKPAASAIPQDMPGLCGELAEFFGCRRFWRMAGGADGAEYSFPAIPTDEAAVTAARAAIKDGEYYLGQGYVMLANVSEQGNDDLVLMYNQRSGQLSLLDIDRQTARLIHDSLPALIERMEALI